MKFFLFLFLCIATCLEYVPAAQAKYPPLASMMVNRTVLHKCNAFFVTKGNKGLVLEGRTLVTTASCVFGITKNFTVGVGNKIIGHEAYYDVEEVFIHPNYSKNPDMYDIAVLHTTTPAKDVVVYELVNSTDHHGINGSLHLWRFVDKTYRLTENNAIFIPDEIYERSTNVLLRCNEIAVMSPVPLTSGVYDVGTPFTVKSLESSETRKEDQNYILGFLGKPREGYEGKFFKLYSIPFYYSWIVSHLKYDYAYY